MPKELHDKLVREARKKGLTGKRANAYVYGTMAKIEAAKKNAHGKLAKHLMK
jgi:hypothetical protein